MLNENMKTRRKHKGLSQEELAQQLHVVRQTVSKWENGSSVPDAGMLIRLAEVLDCTVSELLEDSQTAEAGEKEIASQLAEINAQLARKNRCSDRWWKLVKIIGAVLAGLLVFWVLLAVLNFAAFHVATDITESQAPEQGTDRIETHVQQQMVPAEEE